MEEPELCPAGHPAPAGSNFCPRCGIPLGLRGAPEAVELTEPAPQARRPARPRPSGEVTARRRADTPSLTAEPPPMPPLPIAGYCKVCGNGLVSTAVVCPRCGSPVRMRRPRLPAQQNEAEVAPARAPARAPALLLAVFLSFWTWLYTYRQDGPKFWAGLVVNLVGAACYGVLAAVTGKSGWVIVWLLPALAVWLWAIVSQATKDFATAS